MVEAAYAGCDNLEVMEEAVNYNRYLLHTITRQIRPGDRVLDFGAGAGTFARPLAERGIALRCVEPDDGLRQRLRQSGLDAAADLAEIADASIDVIYTLNVLEHIADDRATAAALAARLAPGGRLIVYVPAFPILFSAMDRKVGHHRRYRRQGLRRLLTEAGLAVERIGYVDCLGFAAALLYRVVGDGGGEINRTALVAYDRFVFPVSRALDGLFHPWLGKNLLARARKPL